MGGTERLTVRLDLVKIDGAATSDRALSVVTRITLARSVGVR